MSTPEQIALAEENTRLEEGNRQLLDEIKRLKEENRGLQKFAEEKQHLDKLDKEIRRLNGLAEPHDFVFELSKSRSEIRFFGPSRFSATGGIPRRLEFNPQRRQTPEPPKIKLPPEILLEIFKAFCSPGSQLILQREWHEMAEDEVVPRGETPPRLRMREWSEKTGSWQKERNQFDAPPILLSHICRSWRNLAISVSSLWSTLTVDPGIWRACEPPLLSLYLERSRGSPLHVTCLDSGFHDDDEFEPGWGAYNRKGDLISALFSKSHADRILSLVVEINADKILTGHFDGSSPAPEFSRLTNLELQWERWVDLEAPEDSDSDSEESPLGLKQIFANVPKLASLTVPYDRTLKLYHHLPFNPQITSLTLRHRLRLIDMLNVIEPYPNLQGLNLPTFALSYTDRIHEIQIKKRFRHDTLSTVVIHFPDYVEDGYESYVDLSLHYLFEFATLPSLRSLKVICPRNIGDVERPVRAWEANAYEEIVARSQCRVERLELVNIYVNSSDIQRTLLASPHLTHFTLFDVEDEEHSGVESTVSLLECLMDFTSEEVLAQKLQELGVAIDLPSLSGEDLARREAEVAERVVRMVDIRQRHHLPPVRLTLRLSQPLLQSTREILERMDKEGIDGIFYLYD
ncbi:hypothetical protein V5O48_014973 [Marasmius crinis-equi]|uniref:F-box domain-containing protein n=1 Tax=Marasmius crinis-equi TaxID=585013 RepID=A0ABR3EVU1_9AGAR